MNILLTGGAGFIGSAASRLLLDHGHVITVLDSLVTGHRAAVPAEATFVEGDLADIPALRKLLEEGDFEAVMHFAAFIEAGESMQEPGKYFRNNLINSLNLIEVCVKTGIERFVLSSTASVYASSEEPISEDSHIQPSNVYGQTKWMIEQALDWYHRLYGLRYAALRYFNAAGALHDCGENHQPESHLIPLVLQVPLGLRAEVHIFGTDYDTPDGTAIRDYVHIEDLIFAHQLALEKLAETPRLVYNLGNGTGYSVRQVIETARAVTGHAIPTVESPRRKGDAQRLVASSDKIRRELGWEPAFPDLATIIASAWDWHKAHPQGYGD